MEQANPYDTVLKSIQIGNKDFKYYSLPDLNDKRIETLPYSIRVLLECAIRNCDEFSVKKSDVEKILDWQVTSNQDVEIPFKPSRVILQDFTGVPAVVDLAAMRDAIDRLGGNPEKINPLCPVDLVIDHSVQVDKSRSTDALQQNEEIEFARNYERFQFLKWGQQAFQNLQIVPPGSGIVHQVNLEYLAKVVFDHNGLLYPDSVVGTDSHTTMINGLGVVGWGVGGIEAEAVMMGQNISMVLPEVVGFKFIGELSNTCNATDLVLTCVEMLRKRKVVGKFVEFFGPGVATLSLADRATVSNMAPEYGATIGYFPIDKKSLEYLRLTGRTEEQINVIEGYLKAQGMFIDFENQQDLTFSGPVLELDLSNVKPCLSGPKRPHDMVPLNNMKEDFNKCLSNNVGFKGFGLKPENLQTSVEFDYQGSKYSLTHGSVVISSITSCTNTSNPGVILAAGLLAKNAVSKGLKVNPYIKTSFSPGSGVVQKYIEKADLQQYLNALGFHIAGFGCMTCIGNSGALDTEIEDAINKGDLVASAVLSGNRNFEGRVHPLTRANYLASPPLCVAYALAGNVNIDFETEPLGKDQNGSDVFLRDIWPSRQDVEQVSNEVLSSQMFLENYQKIAKGTDRWNALQVTEGKLYQWDEKSTYIHNPPFFNSLKLDLPKIDDITNAYVLANFGDSITTDHISPAGNITKNSPAGRYLLSLGVEQKDFNSYGARRGNDEVMARGTFANSRILNKHLNGKVGPQTLYVPTSEVLDIFDAAAKYKSESHQTIILAGNEYGSGSSRDWAAKGPYLQGVSAVIAQSYERIHRSNLVGMGILPLEFLKGQTPESLGITGQEQFSIQLNQGHLKVNQELEVQYGNKSFQAKIRLDTDVEVEYFKNGGILHYVLRKLAQQ